MPALAWRALLALCFAKLALHLATMEGYGFFRDELYYLASTERLAWGYVDHPPLSIGLLRVAEWFAGDDLLRVRWVPALAGVATVWLTGSLAREFGGGARAQTLAAAATLVSPYLLAVGHFYSMNALDVLFWVSLVHLAARILARAEARTWLAFGAIAGLGLLNKLSVGFLGGAFVLGLFLTPARRWLASPWLWAGGAIAACLLLPHVLWQVEHGWPLLEFQANARAEKNVALSALEFAGQQVLMGNPVALPLWLAGLVALVAAPRFATQRALAVPYPALFALFVATNGKSYYLAPAFPLLYAAGATWFEPWLARARWRAAVATAALLVAAIPTIPVGLPVLSQEDLLAWTGTIGLTSPALERHEMPALPQTFADEHGWPELVDAVARAAAALPAHERATAHVLATNYGEAGAVEVLGRGRSLPPVVCGHNSYWTWRPDEFTGPVIALRFSREELERWFASVERVDTIGCEWCMPYQQGSPVHVARDLVVPQERFFAEIRHYR